MSKDSGACQIHKHHYPSQHRAEEVLRIMALKGKDTSKLKVTFCNVGRSWAIVRSNAG